MANELNGLKANIAEIREMIDDHPTGADLGELHDNLYEKIMLECANTNAIILHHRAEDVVYNQVWSINQWAVLACLMAILGLQDWGMEWPYWVQFSFFSVFVISNVIFYQKISNYAVSNAREQAERAQKKAELWQEIVNARSERGVSAM